MKNICLHLNLTLVKSCQQIWFLYSVTDLTNKLETGIIPQFTFHSQIIGYRGTKIVTVFTVYTQNTDDSALPVSKLKLRVYLPLTEREGEL